MNVLISSCLVSHTARSFGENTPQVQRSDWIWVAAGSYATCAIASDYSTYCFGRSATACVPAAFLRVLCALFRNFWNSLLRSGGTYGTLPLQPGKFRTVTMGLNCICGVKLDGTLSCWVRAR